MNRYKSYGQGWHKDSFRHSLAAKGIRSSFQGRETLRERELQSKQVALSFPVGDVGVQKLFPRKAPKSTRLLQQSAAREASGLTEAQRRKLITESPLTASEEKEVSKKLLEATLLKRERRRMFVKRTLDGIPPNDYEENFEEYKSRVKTEISEAVPLDTWIVSAPEAQQLGGAVTKGDKPKTETVGDFIDKMLDEKYRSKFGAYNPASRQFDADFKLRKTKLQTYGGREKEGSFK